MSKFSPLTMVALAVLTACAAAAGTEQPAQEASAAPALALDEAIVHEAPPPSPAPAFVEPEHRAAPAVTCEVRARRTANGVLVQARAFADRDLSGDYNLIITKYGGGGSADISQSGPIDLAAGSFATLGENEISVERGARLRAVLTLHDDRGQVCRRTFNL